MNSIIIPTFCPVAAVENKLRRCLESIFKNTALPYELVIVEQGIPLAMDVIPDNKVLYYHSQKPLGYARAVNIGVFLSTGEHLFIVNNDIEVPPNWDEMLLEDYAFTKGGLLSPIDKPHTVGRPFIFDESWWSCVLISRAVWEKVGALDDIHLNYRLHDQDWSIRCKQAGFDVARSTRVRVVHDESSTYRHMQVDETSERAVMVQRYGVEHFYQWVAQQGR